MHSVLALKLGVTLKRFSCLSEERRVSGREVIVGGRGWSGSISHPIAPVSRVGRELSQQLDPLITGPKDRGDHLSQI
jgi:hypothetical protein